MSNLVNRPNYTQIPNIFFDYWMAILSHAEFKVLMTIARKTFGWSKEKDRISKNQIAKLTGLHRDTIRKNVVKLEEHGLIIIYRNKTEFGDDECNTYEINVIENSLNSEVGVLNAHTLATETPTRWADETPHKRNIYTKETTTKPKAPSAVGKISIVQEKKSVLEQLPLTESQIMSLTRNYELDELKNAVDFYKLQEIKPDNLFGWISSCIKHKYWQNVLNGHKTQKELMANRFKEEVRCSFVEVLKGLDERFKGVIGHQFAKNKKESDIWIKNDYYFVEWDLMNKAKCHELAKKITLSLNENVQVVYNEIPCNNKFEILEDKWK